MFWYHNQTKHSYQSIRTHPNQLSWHNQPTTYKNYPQEYKKQRLNMENTEDNFLFHIAGLSARKLYPSGESYLRINPSAGALYPNELYFQARGVEGLEDGVYHYEVRSASVSLLSSIDQGEGIEPYLGFTTPMKGYLFLVSAIYHRSAWKYKNRAFRYCLLDAGHLLASIEASALCKPHAVQILYDIKRDRLNRLFGFNNQEWFVSGASMAVPIRDEEVRAVEFVLPFVDGSASFEQNHLIEEAYNKTKELHSCKRMLQAPKFTYNKEKLLDAIYTRRSQRGFDKGAITKGQFNFIMDALTQAILSDCDADICVYAVINRVLDMPLGLYKDGEYLRYGDLAREAGYLCLEQYSLGADSAITFFLTSSDSNYQALYQKAGIIGHRLYIVAEYLGLGCSGIGAYYDDEVNTFVDNDAMVLYALAVGK